MINLPRNADLNQVMHLKEKVIETLQAGKKITFNGLDVENISTPLLQLLLISQMEAKKTGASITIKQPSESFVDHIKDFGCFDYLGGAFK